MTGTTAPYCMVNDNVMMSLFIMNLIGIAYVLLINGTSILERMKCMFYYENKTTPFNERTHITWGCNFILYAQTTFYTTIIAIEYLRNSHRLELTDGATPALAISAAIFVIILLLKRATYEIVNRVLFTKEAAQEWNYIYFFTIKLLGFALTPAVITILFIPSVPFIFIEIYLIIVLAIYTYTTFCSLIRIIFAKKQNYLDIFLYLCALEFLPMAMAWKFVLQLNEFITTKV